MKRKICIITGTRAEYGLIMPLMNEINKSHDLLLQLIVTGMHLSPEFGLTYREIEKDGFIINKKIEMILSADTPSSISKSVGLGIICFADTLEELQPDIVVLFGDRFEMLAAAIASNFAKIPIAHLMGGESTVGSIDESIRHSITKMSYWHFVATKQYRKRVIQLGENPNRVFMVGGMGVDRIMRTNLLKKKNFRNAINFTLGKNNLLVTFHPVTLGKDSSREQFNELLLALDSLKETNIIFTYSNADTDGRIINSMIDDFVTKHADNAIGFISMGHRNYLSALQFVDGVVGNSSSGLAEAPSFRIGTINIGERQSGRLKAESVIDCKPLKRSIMLAMKKLYSVEFQKKLKKVVNPYDNGSALEKIFEVLRSKNIPSNTMKSFYDLK